MPQIKKIDIVAYVLLSLAIFLLAFNYKPIAAKIQWIYASTLVRFTTDFESGSLAKAKLLTAQRKEGPDGNKSWQLVYEIHSQSDPLNPVDTALVPSSRWFYFRMTGVKDKQICLRFKDTDPLHPVYSYNNVDFVQFSKSERYFGQVIKHFLRDTVYVAYYTPYTFSYLQTRISQRETTDAGMRLDTIGRSYSGRPLQILTITDTTVPDVHKKRVYMHGRVHTSETPSSWQIDDIIEAITANNSEANAYRQTMIFYIVPMVNPDGVVMGLSRANAQGINLEVNYHRPDSLTAPEVSAVKQILEQLTWNRPLDLVLNMHTQVAPQLSYWIHTATSTSPAYYQQQRYLAQQTLHQAPLMKEADFQYCDLRETCLEGWIWERFREKTLAISFETSYDDYPGLGLATLRAIGTYFNVRISQDTIRLSPYPPELQKLIKVYPNHIQGYEQGYLLLKDGSKMLFDDGRQKSFQELLDKPDIQDMFAFEYPIGKQIATVDTNQDPGRIRQEAFFKKMYGATEPEVRKHLVEIVWCPQLLGQKLKATSVNGVDRQLLKVSAALDTHPEWKEYLKSAGAFYWRPIKGTNRLSTHSFGIAIDLNTDYSDYWQWDYKSTSEDIRLNYKNRIPQGIVDIFEQHGFVWGGRWYHYDTMHFEYRPEVVMQ